MNRTRRVMVLVGAFAAIALGTALPAAAAPGDIPCRLCPDGTLTPTPNDAPVDDPTTLEVETDPGRAEGPYLPGTTPPAPVTPVLTTNEATTATDDATLGGPSGSSRSENVVTGPIADGQLDPDHYKLGYVPGDLVLPWAPDIEGGSLSDNGWGGLSDFAWSGYKYLIHMTLTIVGVVAFGLLIIRWVLDQAFRLGDELNSTVIGPTNLTALPVIFTAIYVGWAAIIRRRYGAAFTEYALTALALAALTATFIPNLIRGFINFISGSSAALLLAGSGGDPRAIPAPTGDYLQTNAITDAYASFMTAMETLLIEKVHQLILFGQLVPEQCAAAYRQIIDANLATSDPDYYRPLGDTTGCEALATAGAQVDTDRLLIAAALFLWAILWALILAWLAWPAVKGQIQIVILAAGHKFALLAAAMPGPMRSYGVIWITRALIGMASLLVLSLLLVLLFIGNTVILTAPDVIPLSVRLFAMLVLDVVLAVLAHKQRGAQKAGQTRFENKAKTSRIDGQIKATPAKVANPVTRTISNVALTKTAVGRAVSATSRILRAADSKNTAATQRVKDWAQPRLTGTDDKPGLLLGPRRAPAPSAPPRSGAPRTPGGTTHATNRPQTPSATPTAPHSPASAAPAQERGAAAAPPVAPVTTRTATTRERAANGTAAARWKAAAQRGQQPPARKATTNTPAPTDTAATRDRANALRK